MFEQLIEREGLTDVYEKVINDTRLSFEDGVRLYKADLTAVGFLANIVRERKSGDKTYWVRNQHLNYTNVCNKFCKFCSFYRPPNDPTGYTMDVETVREKVRQFQDKKVTEIHIVGGVNPRLPYQYYLDVVRAIKEERPDVHVKAFTMIEWAQIQRVAKKPLEECFLELKEAGVESLPGGGAEVFSDRVHENLFHLKADADKWIDIARVAHRCGLPSNATMLYGHVEMLEEKVEHHIRMRELQDETGGILCFIPLSFHPENTELSDLPPNTGEQDLREIAVARLMLDNVPHVKAFWVMISPAVAQVAQWYGADDLDGTVQEYEIIRDPVTDRDQSLTVRELTDMIREAGRVACQRDNLYNVLSVN